MDEDMIGVDDAERTAERYVRNKVGNIISIGVEKASLKGVGDIPVYEVEGKVVTGTGGLLGNIIKDRKMLLFKVQVHAKNGKIVGYEI